VYQEVNFRISLKKVLPKILWIIGLEVYF